jgi:hypothetical protein
MSDKFSVIRAVSGAAVGACAIWLTVKLVNQRRKPGCRFWTAAAALYLVSIGPMGRIAQEADAEWIMYAYFPVVLLAQVFRPFAACLLFYWGLCGVKID